MAKPNYSSNSRIFERRGNPWLTEREKHKDFSRNPETEDAEYDFDHRFHETSNAFGKPKQAPKREEYREAIPVRVDDADNARRKASICRKMNASVHRNNAIEVKPVARHFQPCAGCKSSQCVKALKCYGALK
jgi:hypothetical protein